MEDIISMSHGSGGEKTSKLIEEMMIPKFNNPELYKLGDGALLQLNSSAVAFSTDSFVINPCFFPGGDIGKLSVCGTVNDLLMCGSIPKYLSLSFIIEEGFKIAKLERIIDSIAKTAKAAEVEIVTGDTKVVEKGYGNGIYINTSGIGQKIIGVNLGTHRINVGDRVIVTGSVGNHGISILCSREKYLEENIMSDCTNVNSITYEILKYGKEVKILRDPTRGGLATTLNEFCENQNFTIELTEEKIPIDEEVQSACDLFGIDPLYSANEGKVIAVVSESISDGLIKDLKKLKNGTKAEDIGVVTNTLPGKVIIKNSFGGCRILGKLYYDMLPRIC